MENRNFIYNEPDFKRQLEELHLMSIRLLQGRLGSNKLTNKYGASMDFIDYRKYTQGDDFRNIDWNIYRRLGDIAIKLFHSVEDYAVHIIVDASESMTFYEKSKQIQAFKFLLGFSYITLNSRQKLRVYFAENKTLNQAGSLFSDKNEIRKIDDITGKKKFGGFTDWLSVTDKFISSVNKKGFVIILSDFLGECDWKSVASKFAYKGHELLAVHILSEFELKPLLTGDYLLIDSETDKEIDLTIDHYYLQSYSRSIENYLDFIRKTFVERGFGYIFSDDKMNFVQTLVNYFKPKKRY